MPSEINRRIAELVTNSTNRRIAELRGWTDLQPFDDTGVPPDGYGFVPYKDYVCTGTTMVVPIPDYEHDANLTVGLFREVTDAGYTWSLTALRHEDGSLHHIAMILSGDHRRGDPTWEADEADPILAANTAWIAWKESQSA